MTPVRTQRAPDLRALLLFLAVFAALQLAMIRSEGSAFERALIDEMTVAASAALLSQIYPSDGVRAAGYSIQSQRVRLNVLRGCEGTELYFLVIAGVLAIPASARSRCVALSAGLAVAYALNLTRIAALYATARDAREQFELLHAYVAPTALVAVLGLSLWLWASSQTARTPPAAPNNPA